MTLEPRGAPGAPAQQAPSSAGRTREFSGQGPAVLRKAVALPEREVGLGEGQSGCREDPWPSWPQQGRGRAWARQSPPEGRVGQTCSASKTNFAEASRGVLLQDRPEGPGKNAPARRTPPFLVLWTGRLTRAGEEGPGQLLRVLQSGKHARGRGSAGQVQLGAHLRLVGLQLHLLKGTERALGLRPGRPLTTTKRVTPPGHWSQ